MKSYKKTNKKEKNQPEHFLPAAEMIPAALLQYTGELSMSY